MKFALLVLLVLIGVLLWKNRQPNSPASRGESDSQGHEPLNMVRCSLCSVHVPVAEAIQGKNGVYCSVDHRQHAEP
jgi:uncharacterized protein